MRQQAAKEELCKLIDKLVGMSCWDVGGGINTGSHILLEFGSKVRRERPLRNPRLSPETRLYEGEIGLFVECSWRLESQLAVVCGSDDDNSDDGPMMQGANQLIGRRVESATLREPGFDLDLDFEKDFKLRIFCDEMSSEEGADNYSISSRGLYAIVGGRSKLAKAVYSASPRILRVVE